jgi:CPA1 family monovalent cation:H+ antiporter
MSLSETILLLAILLTLGIFASGLVRKAGIPYTVILVIIGIGVGELSRRWPAFSSFQQLSLTPELVLFVFLPVLIFEAGLKLDARQLIKDIVPVLTLAVPALLISTTIIGIGMWFFLPINLTTGLLFGALISATDPVAVIALFKELGTPQRLTVLVEGESLMNDATAIVLFNILLGLALFGGGSFAEIPTAIGEFVKVFIGGGVAGALFGIVISIIATRLALRASVVMTLSMVFAYGAFVLVEHHLHLSGVMAVAVCALFFGIFGVPKLHQSTAKALEEIWDFLALLANTLLFILVGISVNVAGLFNRLDAILIAVLLVLAARAGVIYSFVPLTVRAFNLPQVTMGERHIMWWGGLKGGLAIAIVLSIPDELPGKSLLLDLTLGVVLFSLMVNAPTIRPLINRLGINRLDEQELEELKQGINLAKTNAHHILDRFLDAGVISRSTHYRVEDNIDHALSNPEIHLTKKQNVRHARIKLLRAEMEELNELYQRGLIQQYTFLDLKGELRRKRENVIAGTRLGAKSRGRKANLFLRMEDALIGSLREHDFAVGLLAHYQNMRLSHHLKKDVARILMTQAAVALLPELNFLEDEQRNGIRETYRQRLKMFRKNINDTKHNFPEFYKRFEARLSTKAALAGALSEVDSEMQHGGIGSKVFSTIERTVEEELERIPSISTPFPELKNSELVGLVPLFKGLPEDALDAIAWQAKIVTFLVDDTVIGQGDHGNALYVIVRGQVGVYRQDDNEEEEQIAVLERGDFFGETALLGDSVRTANVRALMECSLLRITHKTMNGIAENYTVVAERLERERQARGMPKEL